MNQKANVSKIIKKKPVRIIKKSEQINGLYYLGKGRAMVMVQTIHVPVLTYELMNKMVVLHDRNNSEDLYEVEIQKSSNQLFEDQYGVKFEQPGLFLIFRVLVLKTIEPIIDDVSIPVNEDQLALDADGRYVIDRILHIPENKDKIKLTYSKLREGSAGLITPPVKIDCLTPNKDPKALN